MIRIDPRKGSGELFPKFPKGSACLAKTQLPYGDFEFEGNGPDGPCLVGIERKTVTDLLGSMRSGRLAGHQVPGMIDRYRFPFLLLEGRYGRDADGYLCGPPRGFRAGGRWQPIQLGTQRFLYAELEQFVTSLSVLTPIRILKADGVSESVIAILGLEKWFAKPWERHKSVYAFHNTAAEVQRMSKPNLVSLIAHALKGIGADRARELGRRFRTPADLIMAGESEFEQLDGIGKTTARNIVKQLWGE